MNLLKPISPAPITTGTVAAIIGRCGSGKTTLAKTITQLYEDQKTMWEGPQAPCDKFIVTEKQLSESKAFILDEALQYDEASLNAGLKLIIEQVEHRGALLLVLLQSKDCLRHLTRRLGLTKPVKILDLDAAYQQLRSQEHQDEVGPSTTIH